MKKLYVVVVWLLVSVSLSAQNYKVPLQGEHEKMTGGRFQPTWESLESQYKVPEWFRNAKFGIWAHWGPQCVEGSGDWMARSMYIEGSEAYKTHLKKYGHPSEEGFKDVLPDFKAEHWNPDKLVGYYKSLGAEYFFALGNHHDNYDLWDSKYQPWNSQNIGPHKDILAGWAKAARKYGLKFGVSLHADHAPLFYETSRRYDCGGRKMGVPYDGNLTESDGKGKWWEGLNPQDLYVQTQPLSKGSWADGMIHRQWNWDNGAAIPTSKFVANFYDRTLDVINRYDPDLLYFDTTVLPFWPISDCGLKIAADFYNHNIKTHKGKMTAVMFGKILDEQQRKGITWDVERGAPNQMLNQPWQTCSCIGGWHYNIEIYEKGWYKSASTVVKLLVDVVSKNGNLLLSVPLRADGTFDEKEKAILDEFGDWMRVNKESIIGTRPWKVFGEGPIANADIKMNDQGFNEGAYEKAGADEIRFTVKGKILYATALGWPENYQVKIKSLSQNNELYPGKIKSIELLGYGKVKFIRKADALVVSLPEQKINAIAPVLKITLSASYPSASGR